MYWLEEQLKNWGHWLNHDACIGPEYPKCRSIEAHHLAELGEVYEEEEIRIVPDVAAAERLHRHIEANLNRMEKLALAVSYGGLPCVFRSPRMSEYNMRHLAENAKLVLVRVLERAA